MAKGYTSGDQSDSEPDYETQADADTLKKHAEITSDPGRHAKAHAHLQKQVVQGQTAVDASHKQLRGRVKKGLKKAFPSSSGGKTPFEKAEE